MQAATKPADLSEVDWYDLQLYVLGFGGPITEYNLPAWRLSWEQARQPKLIHTESSVTETKLSWQDLSIYITKFSTAVASVREPDFYTWGLTRTQESALISRWRMMDRDFTQVWNRLEPENIRQFLSRLFIHGADAFSIIQVWMAFCYNPADPRFRNPFANSSHQLYFNVLATGRKYPQQVRPLQVIKLYNRIELVHKIFLTQCALSAAKTPVL